eukprot:CAMPEP_0196151692 /NCGR_PEP_ID=MMETSP0910-20130528/34114_1 /TAXON_ID=49265 /ORGANISM="Thalassiosira rotula, Strain GSO102" /LENGTH=34 /DNA_ID= /DNA_START= /DNA_END= /DNA_ORIENTATION=
MSSGEGIFEQANALVQIYHLFEMMGHRRVATVLV